MKCLSGLGEQVCHAGNTLGRSGWCSEDGWLDALLVSEDLPQENRVTVHGPCREIVAIDSYENKVQSVTCHFISYSHMMISLCLLNRLITQSQNLAANLLSLALQVLQLVLRPSNFGSNKH